MMIGMMMDRDYSNDDDDLVDEDGRYHDAMMAMAISQVARE